MGELRIEESHLDNLINRKTTYTYITRICSLPAYNVIKVQHLALCTSLPAVKYYWSEIKKRTLICKIAGHNPELMLRLLPREIAKARPESPATLPAYCHARGVVNELHRD